jgi:Ca2+-binding RTX toxin-like protein
LTGGNGKSTFVFIGDFGHNEITNFNTHTDAIELAQAEFANFDAMKSNWSQVGSDTVITDDQTDNTITLVGVALSKLNAHDFQFV